MLLEMFGALSTVSHQPPIRAQQTAHTRRDLLTMGTSERTGKYKSAALLSGHPWGFRGIVP